MISPHIYAMAAHYGGAVTEHIRNRCAPEALFIEEKNL